MFTPYLCIIFEPYLHLVLVLVLNLLFFIMDLILNLI